MNLNESVVLKYIGLKCIFDCVVYKVYLIIMVVWMVNWWN